MEAKQYATKSINGSLKKSKRKLKNKLRDFPGGTVVKSLPANARDMG